MPGQLKMVSMMTVPPSNEPTEMPVRVMTMTMMFFSTLRKRITRSGIPRARSPIT